MRAIRFVSMTLALSSLMIVRAMAQTNSGGETSIALERISPIEQVGYTKLKSSHWIGHTEIIIDATPEQVWQVLTDTKSYPDWSEIMVKMEGEIVDKGPLDVLFQAGADAKPRMFHHDAIHVEEGVQFYWSDVFAAGIQDRHCFRVEAIEGGKTRFIQSDQALGGATWLFGKRIVKTQMEIYPLFNRALKAEVEKRFPNK